MFSSIKVKFKSFIISKDVMMQRIDIFYSGRIPLGHIATVKEGTSSILARKEDELVGSPLHPTSVPEYLSSAAHRLLEGREYTPETMQNLRYLFFHENGATAVVNATNYGSVVAGRQILRAMNEGGLEVPGSRDVIEDLYAVSRQFAMFGFVGITTSKEKEAVIAPRGGNIQVPGKFFPTPGGNMNYQSDLISTWWEEVKEEVNHLPEDAADVYCIGITRGLSHAWNPGLVIHLVSKKDTRAIIEGLSPEEYAKTQAKVIDVSDSSSFRRDLGKYFTASVDNSNGAFLVLAKHLFGKIFDELVEEFSRPPFDAIINVNNPFDK